MFLQVLRRFPFGKGNSDVVKWDLKELGDYINLSTVIDMGLGGI